MGGSEFTKLHKQSLRADGGGIPGINLECVHKPTAPDVLLVRVKYPQTSCVLVIIIIVIVFCGNQSCGGDKVDASALMGEDYVVFSNSSSSYQGRRLCAVSCCFLVDKFQCCCSGVLSESEIRNKDGRSSTTGRPVSGRK